MKLVVGLGNPGRKYQQTRHNVGFEVIAELARLHGSGGSRSNFQGEVADANLNGERAVLLCPHTFMNKSGTSVVQARDFYKLLSGQRRFRPVADRHRSAAPRLGCGRLRARQIQQGGTKRS